ncbi:hypothetical protein L1987_06167 [Smallanthus sonchifolius]|uniref:Uncharacterized protein n=1 Tax=Smallanthus sonchifolius TaxID=185202 RepID=A0ACB9JXE1_9ASTR|nr:hypothetical protein L1987_06167 [Smallanthus sonchifolius]
MGMKGHPESNCGGGGGVGWMKKKKKKKPAMVVVVILVGLMGVMVVQRVKDRRLFNLVNKEKDRQILTLDLLLQLLCVVGGDDGAGGLRGFSGGGGVMVVQWWQQNGNLMEQNDNKIVTLGSKMATKWFSSPRVAPGIRHDPKYRNADTKTRRNGSKSNKERQYAKENKRNNQDLNAKLYSLGTQKIELSNKIIEMRSTIDSLRDEQRVLELAIDEKQNQIKHEESEIKDLKSNLQTPPKIWSKDDANIEMQNTTDGQNEKNQLKANPDEGPTEVHHEANRMDEDETETETEADLDSSGNVSESDQDYKEETEE